ncbi:MAG: hypothetical protein MI743_15065 [Sneathiellales bacterium]|nr:hypothetical protein [Sneathiellales bacterium]
MTLVKQKYRRAVAAGMAALSLFTFAGVFPSDSYAAKEPAQVKSFTFSVEKRNDPVVRVTSSDGKNWDTLQPGAIDIRYAANIDTKWPGFVEEIVLFAGMCTAASCPEISFGGSQPVIEDSGMLLHRGMKVRDYQGAGKHRFGATKLMNAQLNGSKTKTYGQYIIDQCNAAQGSAGVSKTRKFNQNLMFTMGAETYKNYGSLENSSVQFGTMQISHFRYDQISLKVECAAYTEPATDDLAADLGPLKVTDLKMFLSTFSDAVSNPKAGVECKQGRVLMRAATNRKGTVKFKLTTKVGNQPAEIAFLDGKSKFKGAGNYEAEIKKWISVSKNSVLKAKLETLPASKEVPWKELSLKCSAPGGGGWAQTDKPDPNSDVVQGPLQVSGEIGFADPHKSKGEKARTISVLVKMIANKGSYAKYRLSCTGLHRTWTGKLTPVKQGPGKYVSMEAHSIKLTKNETIDCDLIALTQEGEQPLASKSKGFKVRTGKSVGHVPGGGWKHPQKDEEGTLLRKVTARLAVMDKDKAAGSKPRNATVWFEMTSNIGGNIDYELYCSGNLQWKGGLKSQLVGSQYKGARVVTFPVKRSGHVSCKLHAAAVSGKPVVATASRQFNVKPAGRFKMN